MQSPIDLPESVPEDNRYKFAWDEFNKVYGNPENAKVEWTVDTSRVNFDTDNNYAVFSSWFNYEEKKVADKWEGMYFTWHSQSEHTVAGKRYALELQVYHEAAYKREDVPISSVNTSVISVLFDSDPSAAEGFKDWEIKNIDDMLDSQMWTVTDRNPVVEENKVGDFLQGIDTRNRWVYDGSMTTPPCESAVQWNVVRKVYPVKERHLKQFQNQLARETS